MLLKLGGGGTRTINLNAKDTIQIMMKQTVSLSSHQMYDESLHVVLHTHVTLVAVTAAPGKQSPRQLVALMLYLVML